MAGVKTVGVLEAVLRLQDAMSPALNVAAKNVRKAGQRFERVGGQLTRGLGLPLAAVAGGAVKAAIDFESSFAGVRKTVDATEAEFGELSAAFRELATTIPISIHEINKIAESAGQLGIATENLVGFTETMAQLGVATNMSADEAATSLARLANITGMQQDQFDQLGATVVDLGNNFATTEAEVVGFGLRIAGAGAQVGMSEAEILALGTALSSVGINAEAGGTAISRVMIEIATQVEQGGDQLDKFAAIAARSGHVAEEDFARAWREDAAGALVSFVEGLGTLDEAGISTFGVLEDLGLQEIRVRDAMLRASGAGNLLRDAVERGSTAWAENTALTREAQTRFATVESRMKTLWGQVYDLRIELGQALLPVFESLMRLAQNLIPIVGGLVAAFAGLPGPLRDTIAGVVALGIAIGPVLMIFGSMMSAFGSFLPLLGVFGRVVGKLIPTLGKYGTRIARVAKSTAGLRGVAVILGRTFAWLVTTGGPIGLVLKSFALLLTSTKSGRRMLAAFFELVRTAGEVALGGLSRVLGLLWEDVKAFGGAVRDFFAPALEAITFFAEPLAEKFEAWTAKLKATEDAAEKVAPAVDQVTEAVEAVATPLEAAGDAGEVADGQLSDLAATLSDAGLAGDVAALETAWAELDGELRADAKTLDRVGEAALALEARGGELSAGLRTVAERARDADAAKEALDEELRRTEAIRDLADDLGDAGLAGEVADLDLAWQALKTRGEATGRAFDAVGERARALKDRGGELTEELDAVAAAALAVEDQKRALDAELARVGAVRALADEIGGVGLTGEVDKLNEAWDLLVADGPPTRAALDALGERALALKDKGAQLSGAVDEVATSLDAQREAAKKNDAQAKKSKQAWDNLRGSMTALSQVLGGRDAGVLGTMGVLIGSWDAAKTSAATFGDGLRSLKGDTGGIVDGIANIAGGLMGMIGIAVQAGQAIFQAFKMLGRSVEENVVLTASRRWGVLLSEGLSKQIAADAERIGHDYAAMLLSLDKVFAEAGVGIGISLSDAIAATRDLFVMLDEGRVSVQEVGPVFDRVFGELLPHAVDTATGLVRADFQELIALAREFGVESEAVSTFIRDQATAGVDHLRGYFNTAIALTVDGMMVASQAAVEFFNAQILAGASFSKVMRDMGPDFVLIGDRMRDAGLEGSAAFRTLEEAAGLVTDEVTGPLIAGAESGIGMLTALANLGVTDLAPSFATVGASVGSAFQELIDGGASSEAAMMALSGPIGTLIALQDEHGFSVGATTAGLLDQARQAGITGEIQKSAQDRTADAVEDLRDIFAQVFGVDVPGAAETGTRAIATKMAAMQATADHQLRTALPDAAGAGARAMAEDWAAAAAGMGRQFRVDLPAAVNTGGAAARRNLDHHLGQMARTAQNFPPVTIGVEYGGEGRGRVGSFATGTGGQFVDFGRGSLAVLHGREAVVPEGELGPGVGGVIAELASLRAEMQADREFQAALLPKQVAAAIAQGGEF